MGVQRLVERADGRSVTKKKLEGEETWFPKVGHFFAGEDPIIHEYPQHMVLLTAGNRDAILRVTSEGETAPIADGEGVLICTESSLIGFMADVKILSDSFSTAHIRIPYGNIEMIFGNPGPRGLIEISTSGQTLRFNIAKSADETAALAVYRYLTGKV